MILQNSSPKSIATISSLKMSSYSRKIVQLSLWFLVLFDAYERRNSLTYMADGKHNDNLKVNFHQKENSVYTYASWQLIQVVQSRYSP